MCIYSWFIVISVILVFGLQNRYPNKLIARNPFGGSIFYLIIFMFNYVIIPTIHALSLI
nr:MAG TPA: hypothetical protein [Caudoviricetes sp.]